MRGINACQLQMQDFFLPSTAEAASQPGISKIFLRFTAEVGDSFLIVPQYLKNVPGINSCAIQLKVDSNSILDPLRWLHVCMHMAYAVGHPVESFIVRTSSKNESGFTEEVISRAGLHDRMVQLMGRLGIYEGESMHSWRRGMAIEMQANGSSNNAIMQQMLISTESVLERCYLPPGLHDTSIKQVRSIAEQHHE